MLKGHRRRTWITLVAGGALTSAAILTMVVINAQSQTPPAATVGSAVLSQAGDAQIQTTTARVQQRNPAFSNNASTWVDKQLMYQEAVRRGLACSTGTAAQQLRDTYAQTLRDGQPDTLVIAATDSGIAPQGYDRTPAALRTPGTDAIIQQYLNDPRVIASQAQACSIMALAAKVNTADTNGIETIVAEGRKTQPIAIATPAPAP